MEFFTDADAEAKIKWGFGRIETCGAGGTSYDGFGGERYISLEKANRLLNERGLVVKAHRSSLEIGSWYEDDIEPNPTHQALLIAIEPIEKDSADKIIKDIASISREQILMGSTLSEFYDRARALIGEGE